MRWFFAIIAGFSVMLIMNIFLVYVAFNGGDTVLPSYTESSER